MSEGSATIQQNTAFNSPVLNSNRIDAKDVMLKLVENTSAIKIDITKIQGSNALVADRIGRIEEDIRTIKSDSLTNDKAKILMQTELKEFKKDSLTNEKAKILMRDELDDFKKNSLARKDFWILAGISLLGMIVSIIIKII